jgi:hypothetical protein
MLSTPSTSKPFKEAYTISFIAHLKKILNNPLLFEKMYFGPGVHTEERVEYWHGDIWAQSPLFGKEYLHCGEDGKYVEISCFEYTCY